MFFNKLSCLHPSTLHNTTIFHFSNDSQAEDTIGKKAKRQKVDNGEKVVEAAEPVASAQTDATKRSTKEQVSDYPN